MSSSYVYFLKKVINGFMKRKIIFQKLGSWKGPNGLYPTFLKWPPTVKNIYSFFSPKSGFAFKLLSQVTKKGTKTPFFWMRGRGIFFGVSFSRKKNCNFFSLLISFQKMVSVLWLNNSILSYKIFKCRCLRYVLII